MLKLSLIIPAKQLNENLFDTICHYKLNINNSFEIIIVYDSVSEDVFQNFTSKFKNNSSIILLKSPAKGRINALNYGYSFAKGNIIKCIDDDDILLEDFFDSLEILDKYSAHCHNATLISHENVFLGHYTFEKNILFKNYDYVLRNLKSPPRWTWSFKREIADLIFPIPPELFAEDIWFSLIIKKNCKKIFHINKSIYLYRQHEGGEWGGIKNFSPEIMSRRAKWNLGLIPILLEKKTHLGIVSDDIFSKIENYYKVLEQNRKISNIFFAKTSFFYKIKLLIIMYSPSFASFLLSFKWFVTKKLITIRSL